MVRDTSKQAYAGLVLPKLGEKQLIVYQSLLDADTLTNAEIGMKLGWTINCVTPRVCELRKMGLVEDNGRRLCSVTGRSAHAWRVIKNTLF